MLVCQLDVFSDDDMVQCCMQVYEKVLVIVVVIDFGEGIGDIKDVGIGLVIIFGKIEQVIVYVCVFGGRGKFV